MVGHEAPGEQARVGALDAAGEALEELLPIAVMLEDCTALNTVGDDVMQGVGSIEARYARHRGHAYGDLRRQSRDCICSISTTRNTRNYVPHGSTIDSKKGTGWFTGIRRW